MSGINSHQKCDYGVSEVSAPDMTGKQTASERHVECIVTSNTSMRSSFLSVPGIASSA